MAEQNIESLSPLEFTRLRPELYCGTTETSMQLVTELVSNSVDEHNIGNGDKVTVVVKDNYIMVQDEGQGFPIGETREDGITVLQAAFSVMNTSGKYRDDGIYEGVSRGSLGLGSKISIFLSNKAIVESWRNGKIERDYFTEGVLSDSEIEDAVEDSKSGTRVTIYPSAEFFKETMPRESDLQKSFDELTALCKDLTIELTYNDKKTIFSHPEGLEALLKQKVGKGTPLTESFICDRKTKSRELQVAMVYCAETTSTIAAYVNYGSTDAGPHITTMKSCITKILNKWAREEGLLKQKDSNLTGANLQEGLTLIFNLISPGVAYDAQIKSRVVSNDFVPFINEVFGNAFEFWLDSHQEDAKIIVEKAITARKAAEAAKKARERVRNNGGKKVKNITMPTSLTDAWSKDRSKCELYIAEGLSGGSGLIAARNSEFQAVYSIRGKSLNPLKTAAENVYKNKEINNLITAIGLDVNPKNAKCKYDINKLRYGKIIAAADADFDGFAIKNLLFNIFWYICPELILNGHIYSSQPPLFKVITKKNDYIYLHDQEALDKYKETNGNEIKVIERNKGLGSSSAEELSVALLQKDTRQITKLTSLEDIEEIDNTFQDLYGKKVEPRVKFLLDHSDDVTIDME